MFRIAALLFALLIGFPAHAQIFGPAVYTPTVTSGGGYTGPGDVVAGVAHFYGVEAVNAAYATPGTNPSFDYSCSGGSPATGTIKILSTGFADATTLSTACGANTIDVTKIYDQVGTVNIDTNGTTGNVTVTLNCVGTHPCFVSPGAGGGCMYSSTTLSLTAPFTLMAAYAPTGAPGGNGRAFDLQGGGTEAFLGMNNSDTLIGYHGSILPYSSAATPGTMYAVAAAMDATGIIGVDGSTATGTIGNASISGANVELFTSTNVGSCSNQAAGKILDFGAWASSWSAGTMSSVSAQERSNFGF